MQTERKQTILHFTLDNHHNRRITNVSILRVKQQRVRTRIAYRNHSSKNTCDKHQAECSTVATLEECNGDAGYCDIGWFVRATAVILTAVARQTMRTLVPQVKGRFSPERDLTPKTSHQSRVGFWSHLGRVVTLFDVRPHRFVGRVGSLSHRLDGTSVEHEAGQLFVDPCDDERFQKLFLELASLYSNGLFVANTL